MQNSGLYLSSFSESDITNQYIEWINDPEVNRYLESRHHVQNRNTVENWVRSTNSDPTRCLIGIFRKKEHLGNITLYMIDSVHKCLRIGITVGRKDLQKHGYGAKALYVVVKYIFEEMQFNRIEAGIYQGNDTSIKLFQKIGFRQEAVFRKRVYFEGKFVDMILFAYLRDEFIRDLQKNSAT
jgi:RimJ/RimL family protein N-acetyltransferase